MKTLDWRGTAEQEKLCDLAKDPRVCIQETNNALRPVLNPYSRSLAGEAEKNACDYGQTAYDLIALGNALRRIQGEILNFLMEEGQVDTALKTSTLQVAPIKIGELAAQVVAERMIQECHCKK
ncbi:hypothetical protein LCGC14_0655040 [marine sediment metagenome]|uniref:Uncharacterized protein n=1 Tax=marine sediment metagenome TaxID=412755 RepID=A0A0F9RF64_9ZZZZ